MAIPKYDQLMLPLLKILSDCQPHRHRDVIETLATEFQLSDTERKEFLPSGRQTIFDNRVGWADFVRIPANPRSAPPTKHGGLDYRA
jgi:restriction system protein